MATLKEKFTNKKGFTMVELLLVILLIGLLSVVSFSAYTGSVATFKFLANYQSAMALIRNARSYAIVNKNSENIERYGVKIEPTKVTLFEDNLGPLVFDDSDTVLEKVDFVETPFAITNASESEYMPTTLFYDTGSGSLTAKYGESGKFLISKTEYPYIAFKFTDGKLSRYIVVFQVSGLVEDFYQSPIL